MLKFSTWGRIWNHHRVLFEGVTSLHPLITTTPRLWLRVASDILRKLVWVYLWEGCCWLCWGRSKMWAGGWWCRRDRWKWRGKNGMEYTVQVLQRIGHTPGPPSKPSSCLHSCLDHSFLINRESTVTCAQMCNLNMQLTEIVLLEHGAVGPRYDWWSKCDINQHFQHCSVCPLLQQPYNIFKHLVK